MRSPGSIAIADYQCENNLTLKALALGKGEYFMCTVSKLIGSLQQCLKQTALPHNISQSAQSI